MEIGFLHSHVAVVTLFLIFLLFKTVLLLSNKKALLEKVRTRFKMVDPILGTLMLVTGGYMLYLYGGSAPIYLWVKLVLVLIIIPIGIVAFKKENKIMATLALLLTLYIYGVSEAGSLTFSKDSEAKSEITVKGDSVELEVTEGMLTNGEKIYLAECKKCHGTDGKKGLFKAPDLTKSELTLEERIAWIKQGKGVMPSYEGKLSADDIKSVAAYIEELK
ncbi:SirB2 family protein [Marivirga atlantica]|uniref:SirB2 family protein n=1 Tax=Marivirga atlantica TaxID=1548457 RepID=A0A937A7T1_9BACT|nr:SirB2 family protein [Marivirga atlantica]MBL0763755.1 SirB2 family protein [Marivirga atlantica]